MIVLSPNPAYTVREQLERLYKRRPFEAVWICVNLLMLGLLLLVLALGPALLAVILGNEEEPLLIVLAAALGLVGLTVAEKVRRPTVALVLRMTGALVQAAVQQDAEDAAPLTRLEQETLAQFLLEFADLEERVRESDRLGRPQPLAAAREHWQKRRQGLNGCLSRRNLSDRLLLLERVLMDGGGADPADVSVYSAVLLKLIDETREAIRRKLDGRSVPLGASMWPYTYENGRRRDREEHGGRPASLRSWLGEMS